MKMGNYIKDKVLSIILIMFMMIIVFSLLFAFKVDITLIIAFIIIFAVFFIGIFCNEFFKKKVFFDQLRSNLEGLDKKYLITEIITEPDFYEGKILYQALYEIDKSMKERINYYKYGLNDFKEYIELWIHEVKIPLSSLLLMHHNHKGNTNNKELEQIKRIDNYIEQVLYYVRSENSEKDYLIKKVLLKDIVNELIIENQDLIRMHHIELEIGDLKHYVHTDSKWLKFMLNQVLQNSIKYMKDKNKVIKINTIKNKDTLKLFLYDNGIGIPNKDIRRIFDKSFTGENGRRVGSSTGIGLYLCKKLSTKLGHDISVHSREGEFTEIILEFSEDKYYEVVK